MTEETAEKLRKATVRVLLGIRSAYLAAGANPLKHWDQLADRLRAAARTSGSVPEWYATMTRTLAIGGSLSSGSSADVVELQRVVTEEASAEEWLDLLEREHAFIMAMARLEAEQARGAAEMFAG